MLLMPRRAGRGLVLVLALALLLAACAAPEAPTPPELPAPAPSEPLPAPAAEAAAEDAAVCVGLCLPDAAWQPFGEAVQRGLAAEGVACTLAEAAGDPARQAEQAAGLLDGGAQLLLIVPVEDGAALGGALSQAKAAGVPVVSCDRRITGSDAVTAHLAFDETLAGVMQGQFLADALDLAHAGEQSYHIECFAGDPGDERARLRYEGAMCVLQPYFDAGTLRCLSGETALSAAGTAGWDSAAAQTRFARILDAYYGDQPLHAVLASDDSLAQGVLRVLMAANRGEAFPVLTGAGCAEQTLQDLLEGRQGMSIYFSPDELVAGAVRLCLALVRGETPPLTDPLTFAPLPALLCPPCLCTRDNLYDLPIAPG